MRVFSCKSGVAALAVVALLAVSAQAAVVTGTTYTYLNHDPGSCCDPNSPDYDFVGGVYGSGWLNNGAFGVQAYLDGDPRPNHFGSTAGFAYQIEGDAVFNGGYTAATGGMYSNYDARPAPMELAFNLGANYTDLTTLTLGLVSESFHGIKLPGTITVSDGTSTVTDTTFTGVGDTNSSLYPLGQYVNHAIDISSLSGQNITITLSCEGDMVSILEAQFENAGGEIPEPSTLVLLTCGLIGLLAYAWKRRK